MSYILIFIAIVAANLATYALRPQLNKLRRRQQWWHINNLRRLVRR